jgi:hypothetical protein
VSTWSVVFLGIIAVATLATAVVQIGLLVAAGLLTRRLGRFVDEVEREVKPIIGHLNSVSRDASRAAAIAVAQVERVDDLCSDVAAKIDQTITTIHSAIVTPAREGRAWLLGFQAVMAALREFRSGSSRSSSRDEEDGLFI